MAHMGWKTDRCWFAIEMGLEVKEDMGGIAGAPKLEPHPGAEAALVHVPVGGGLEDGEHTYRTAAWT